MTPFDTYLDPTRAAALFAERLATQTDVSDVHADLDQGGFVLLDVRSDAAWAQGHIPGAVHLPRAQVELFADRGKPVVAYCWGPGCNGATRAAHALALRGFRVKEMLGGIEYWIREGFPVLGADGEVSMPVDTLTACGC
jgi:rhodanese-related sulfurtransferase